VKESQEKRGLACLRLDIHIAAQRSIWVFFSSLLKITTIAFQGQFTNMLGEKRAGVSVKEDGECRPVCKQLRQLIKLWNIGAM
jgi:hypothetical protein